MVHSFEYQGTARGASLLFKVDGKQRRIIFDNKSEAMLALEAIITGRNIVTDEEWQMVIYRMRNNGWSFKANPNNQSVFRPVAKRMETTM